MSAQAAVEVHDAVVQPEERRPVTPEAAGSSPASIASPPPLTETVPEQIARDLRMAAALLERPGGWIKGVAYYEGSYCLYGAIDKVTEDRFVLREGELFVYARAHDAMLCIEDRLGMPPIAWNDEPCRTQHEVVAMLRSVADELERGL